MAIVPFAISKESKMKKENSKTKGQAIYSEYAAAKHLGISYQTIRAYRVAGKIRPCSPIDEVPRLFTQAELDRARAEILPKIEHFRARAGWGHTRSCKFAEVR